jgi:hypothetical protein
MNLLCKSQMTIIREQAMMIGKWSCEYQPICLQPMIYGQAGEREISRWNRRRIKSLIRSSQ